MLDFSLPSMMARAIILLIGFPIHEAAHAWMAYRLGDDTAKSRGRLTLNPLAHLDVVGSLMLLVSPIGWAKPVPVNPYQLRHGPRLGGAMVAAAGPLSNLAMATVAALIWRLGFPGEGPDWLPMLVVTFVGLNLSLFLFNLIPLAPLDGNSVLYGLVGERGAAVLQPLRTYGPQLLMALIFIGFIVPGVNLLGRLLYPAMNALMALLLGL